MPAANPTSGVLMRLMLALLLSPCLPTVAVAALDARMIRQPDVSDTQVTFVYAGDIWVAPLEGGVAQRLSTPEGQESLPRFSPDGKSIAFSAQYDGNVDAYVVPSSGGATQRLTWHPAVDRVLDWMPDGQRVLFASGRESPTRRYQHFFTIAVTGGLPERVPIPYGAYGSFAADGRRLAYVTTPSDLATWKRYRGGTAPDIWLYDVVSKTSSRLAPDVAIDSQPMWRGDVVYFLSDRDGARRLNIWSVDTKTGETREVTHFVDHDTHFPAIGPAGIVFENGGRLWLLDPGKGEPREIPIEVVTDEATLKPRVVDVSDRIASVSVSPSGKRVAIEARGEVFNVPVEHGATLNLTRSSGAADRHPAWSPDGLSLAWFSDASGEYELMVGVADGSKPPRAVTALGPGYRYAPHWSPDSKSIAFIDQAMRLQLCDVATGKVKEIAHGAYLFHGELSAFTPAWSADSRWLAWAWETGEGLSTIFVHDTKSGETKRVTSGFTDDRQPSWDPKGRWLFYVSRRTWSADYGDLDNTWIYTNGANVVALPLRSDGASPLPVRNDAEGDDDEEKDAKDDKAKDADAGKSERHSKGAKDDKPGRAKKEKEAEARPEPVRIDFDGIESRGVTLPIEPGEIVALNALDGKLLYQRNARTGSKEDAPAALVIYDFEKREEKVVLADVDAVILAAGREKALVLVDKSWYVVDVEADQKLDKPVPTDQLEMTLDPRAEWHQLFADAWRFERDYFYDPGMHGVDWPAMRERYGRLIDACVTRWDVEFVIGELIGELCSSHAYIWGGDVEEAKKRPVGLLGCDFALEDGHFRIAHVVRGAPWDSVRSPLDVPGSGVHEGDWLLAIDGVPLDPAHEPWAALAGRAGRTVQLTVNDAPRMEGARVVAVDTLEEEGTLRYREWVERNRVHVEQRTQGRVGYLHVPDTGSGGQSELYRGFMPQFRKPALIIDERFNSGGQIPDRFVELLDRPLRTWWAVRDGKDWQWPPVAHFGPKVMLVNEWSGSGGDCFPLYFRQSGLGPIIGRRTWGGLIGISGAPELIDGGTVTVPTFAIYSPEGKWIVENHGVDPDIEVIDDPAVMADGTDPQLERAIDEALALLEKNPPPQPKRPGYTVR
jgi:tricorn protease